jgi:hypothetical protein
MTTRRRVRVRGIRKEEIDTDQLALVYWLLAKQIVDDKREQAAQDKATRGRKSSTGETAR